MLTSQLDHMAVKFSESTINNSAGIFLIKTVLETLDRFGDVDCDLSEGVGVDSQGVPMSEKNIRYIFSACCKELAIKMNGKGGIAGLGFDISVVCSVLHVIGMTKLLTELEVESTSKAVTDGSPGNLPSSASSTCSTESLESSHSRSILETPLITVLNNITSSIPLLFGVFPGASKPSAADAPSASSSSASAAPVAPSANGSVSSVIVKAFVTRWSDILTKYVKVLKEGVGKQEVSAPVGADGAVAASVDSGAADTPAGGISSMLNILDEYASDHRVWALRSNEAEASVDLAPVLGEMGATTPIAMTPLSLLTSPRETLSQCQRVIYAEQVALESEEYLMRRLLARAGVNINEVVCDEDADPDANANANAVVSDETTDGIKQVPYFRLGTRYLASGYKYTPPKPKAEPVVPVEAVAEEKGPDVDVDVDVPAAPPTLKQLKKMRKELRLAKAAAKELAKRERAANRARGKPSSQPGTPVGSLSATPSTPVLSTSMAEVYKQSFGNGAAMTAQMLIDKARKIRKHNEAYPVPFESVAKRYRNAMAIYTENNVGKSILSSLKSGPGVVRGQKKRANSASAGDLASALTSSSSLAVLATLKKRKSHLLAPLAINMHTGMSVTPTGLEGSLYAAVPVGVTPTPATAPELFTAKGNLKKGASAMDLASLKKSSSVSDLSQGFTTVSTDSSSTSGNTKGAHLQVSKAGHILLPDLVIRTTEVPWLLVAKEFATLDYVEELGDNSLLRRANTIASGGSVSPSLSAVSLTKDGKVDRRRKHVEEQEQIQHPPKRGRTSKISTSTSSSSLNSLSPGASGTDSITAVSPNAVRRQSSVVVAPKYDEIEPTTFAKYPKHIKPNLVAPPKADDSGSEEDVSDEHMLAAHDAVLASMREKWVTFRSNCPGGGGNRPKGGNVGGVSAGNSSPSSGPRKGSLSAPANKGVKRNGDDGRHSPSASRQGAPPAFKKPRGRPAKNAPRLS